MIIPGIVASSLLGGVVTDPDFSSVTVLLGFDGTDASTTFTDESSVGRSFAANGNAQLDTAQKVFGTASLLLDGTGDSVATSDAADLDFGSGDFTVECRIRFSSAGGDSAFVGQYDTAANDRAWLFWRSSANLLVFNWSTNGTDFFSSQDTWNPSLNTWYVLAADRASGVLRVYLNGAMHSKNASASATFNNSAVDLIVGDQANGGRDTDGWIEELRITKGVARYASDSGYTVATEAFPRS